MNRPRIHKLIYDGPRHVYEHILIAEKALGKSLPKGAQVHHIDENPLNNDPNNLVVCPDQAYHRLLHRRMKAFEACGNPDYYRCRFCGIWSDPTTMIKDGPRNCSHSECRNTYRRQKYYERNHNS